VRAHRRLLVLSTQLDPLLPPIIVLSKALDEAIVSTTIEMSKAVAAPNTDKIPVMGLPAVEEAKGDNNLDELPRIEHASEPKFVS
jgi:hypothetical protein